MGDAEISVNPTLRTRKRTHAHSLSDFTMAVGRDGSRCSLQHRPIQGTSRCHRRDNRPQAREFCAVLHLAAEPGHRRVKKHCAHSISRSLLMARRTPHPKPFRVTLPPSHTYPSHRLSLRSFPAVQALAPSRLHGKRRRSRASGRTVHGPRTGTAWRSAGS